MIKIKKEILGQIQRSGKEDPRYFIKILRRINPEIKKVIQFLTTSEISLKDACTFFCAYCENGLDNFVIGKQKDTVEEFFKKIEDCNTTIADYIVYCDFSQANRLMTLVILYRVFESELEIRELQ